MSSTTAAKTGTAQPATREYAETFAYDGIGNISRAVATRETNTDNSRPDVRRDEAYTPVVGQQAGTVIDQVNKITDTGTAAGRSALEVRYGYDLSNRLVSVTRVGGPSETLDYGPSGELSHRRMALRLLVLGVLGLGCGQGVPVDATDCAEIAAAVSGLFGDGDRSYHYIGCGDLVYDGNGALSTVTAKEKACAVQGCREWAVSFEEGDTTRLTMRLRSAAERPMPPAGLVWRLTWARRWGGLYISRKDVIVRY